MRQKIGLAASLCDNCLRALTIAPRDTGHWPRGINSRVWSSRAGSSDRGSQPGSERGTAPDLSTWFRLWRQEETCGIWPVAGEGDGNLCRYFEQFWRSRLIEANPSPSASESGSGRGQGLKRGCKKYCGEKRGGAGRGGVNPTLGCNGTPPLLS